MILILARDRVVRDHLSAALNDVASAVVAVDDITIARDVVAAIRPNVALIVSPNADSTNALLAELAAQRDPPPVVIANGEHDVREIAVRYGVALVALPDAPRAVIDALAGRGATPPRSPGS